MTPIKVLTGITLFSSFSMCGLIDPAIATPYYGPGIGSCQDAKTKQRPNARCFDMNDPYARYESYSDWKEGKKSKALWPGME